MRSTGCVSGTTFPLAVSGRPTAVNVTMPNSRCRIDILWRWRKSGIEGYCSGNEELDRSAAQNLFRVLLSNLGNIERRNAEHMFAIDAQYLAARRQLTLN
jgi:hypothetical protein